jgi:hypothetical protein
VGAPADVTIESEIISKHDLSPETGYSLGIRNSRFTAFVHDGTSEFRIDGGPIDSGKWYHVVANHSGASFALWVNAALAGSIPAPPPATSTSSLRMGCGTGGVTPTKSFTGTIDEVAIYPANISALTISSHFERLRVLTGN